MFHDRYPIKIRVDEPLPEIWLRINVAREAERIAIRRFNEGPDMSLYTGNIDDHNSTFPSRDM